MDDVNYRPAMAQVEQRFAADGDRAWPAPSVGDLVALLDSLRVGTLSETQQQAAPALRGGLLAISPSQGTRR